MQEQSVEETLKVRSLRFAVARKGGGEHDRASNDAAR